MAEKRSGLGMTGNILRFAGIFEASLVSSMLPWKGLGMSKATAHARESSRT